jgi:hypothetical protein
VQPGRPDGNHRVRPSDAGVLHPAPPAHRVPPGSFFSRARRRPTAPIDVPSLTHGGCHRTTSPLYETPFYTVVRR